MVATANDLRALAARMLGAAGRRITVQPESAEAVAHALRAYADMISRPAIDEVGPFQVDVWDGDAMVETTAKCSNLMVAHGAFEATVRERGRYEVTLRGGIRVIARHAPASAEG